MMTIKLHWNLKKFPIFYWQNRPKVEVSAKKLSRYDFSHRYICAN